jgi:signal transduction histidine kinase
MAAQLQGLHQLTIAVADELRRAIFSLTGPEHEGNLTDDLRRLLRDFERRSDVQVHLAVSGEPTPAAEIAHDAIHLVVNEALTNIAKHARATVVLVSLRYEADHLDIAIQDDGVGAPAILLDTYQDSYLHFGLRHMRQVVIDRGGAFAVANGDGAGLVVRASIPLTRQQP